jgi:arsenate reductase (thioredoxin)
MKKKLLILCTGNSCRSQMAEAYFRKFHGTTIEVFSAGIEKHGLNPTALRVLQEDGIDTTMLFSKTIEEIDYNTADILLTVCDHAKETCPVVPSKAKKIHHSFPDPARFSGTESEILEGFRAVRDTIKLYAKNFSGS